jgi:hypothetical protein
VGGLVVALALPGKASALGPLEKDHPLVEKGREAYTAGRFEDALAAFEEARKERPDDPAVEFNRGDALAKLGRVDEAKAAFQRVAESNRPDLKQKAHYNLGNLYATTGKRKEALQEYRRALKLDPTDALARHNFEVVLRDLPPPQNDQGQDGGSDGGADGGSDGGQDGGQDAGADAGQKGDGGSPVDGGTDGGTSEADAGTPDAGDGGADGGGGDGGQGDGGSDGGADGGGQQGDQQGDGGADGGSDGGQQQGEPEPGDGGADGGTGGEEVDEVDAGVSPEDIDKQEAERLLDAMKQNEKNLQLWRFQQKKKPRKPNEKDW